MTPYMEALIIWDWVQWRLTPAQWLQAQRILRPAQPPTVQTPALAQGLAQILDPQTTEQQRLALVEQLLTFIKANQNATPK